MHAVEIAIHNFRTYADSSVSLHPYTVLLGQNNCGKSNLVDAIRVFYEDLKFDAERDFPRSATEDQESWIEVEYKPTAQELENLKEEYRLPRGTFRLRKYLRSQDGALSGIYAYVGGELSESRFYGAKNVQQGKLGKVIHIPSVSKLADSTKLTGPSPLRELLNVVLKAVIGGSDAYAELEHSFDVFEAQLKTETTDDGLSLESIEQEICEGIRDWGIEFRISIDALDLRTMVKYLVRHRVVDDVLDEPMDADAYGQGFQRHLIFTLIRLAAKHSSPTMSRPSSEFSPSLIWVLYEEPEAFLHPTQLSTLDTSLKALSSDQGAQVLITTHNPQFVSCNVCDLPSLARFRKEGAISKVGQVSGEDVYRLFEENQSQVEAWKQAGLPVNEEDLEIEMEAAKHSLWLNPLRCSAFFADAVLLVEGPTERALIGRMLASGEIDGLPSGTFVMDCLGKYNIHRFMNLFSLLGVPHGVIFDLDDGKHPFIETTIRNCATDTTLGIAAFPRDVEDFLGVPRCNQSHRKPQHVMYWYREERIERQKLDSLGELVASALSG